VPDDWQETPLGRQLHGLYFRMGREQSQLLKTISVRDQIAKESEETDARMHILTEYDT